MPLSESTSTEFLHAQAKISNYIFNFVSSSAVRCALQLGISDVLYKHEKPMCLFDLSVELSVVNSSKISFLPILMRFLVQSGFLNQHEDQYFLTPASRLLAKNEPFNVKSLLLANHSPIFSKAWSELSDWFQNDSLTPFHTAHGKSLWDCIGEEQPSVLGDIFNDALASDSRLNTNVLITECKHVFEGLTSLVEVGGGTGTVSIAIANTFPNIKCTVLDLPQVIGDLKGSGNLDFIGGDMFDKIPHANAILLKCVLHDWNDEDCVKILKKFKESIPSKKEGGKVIIIDIVLENPKQSNEFVRAQHNMDMLMMVLCAAKERTEKEWEKLFVEAGFNEYKIFPILGLRLLEFLPP
ncbi:hypothetical protein R3W88_001781 [Solanum pinnatisectum]|uniref:Myricetin 7/4'-O-methyltransferase 2 n=1 Tax=Solanum pinnatisectum TaxID=50273 RepID=A0AAV9MJB4_9SOLN|nr:hypothetical protein R3W88_001781 [Solanum pinnatisectum]